MTNKKNFNLGWVYIRWILSFSRGLGLESRYWYGAASTGYRYGLGVSSSDLHRDLSGFSWDSSYLLGLVRVFDIVNFDIRVFRTAGGRSCDFIIVVPHYKGKYHFRFRRFG